MYTTTKYLKYKVLTGCFTTFSPNKESSHNTLSGFNSRWLLRRLSLKQSSTHTTFRPVCFDVYVLVLNGGGVFLRGPITAPIFQNIRLISVKIDNFRVHQYSYFRNPQKYVSLFQIPSRKQADFRIPSS